jgi:uncharacterized membrane protein YkoI
MKHILIVSTAAAVAAAALSPAALLADSKHPKEHELAREALRRGEILPLTKILPIVQKRVPGEVIKVSLDDDPDHEHTRRGIIKYEVKVLTAAGEVIEVELDARTGRILEVEED